MSGDTAFFRVFWKIINYIGGLCKVLGAARNENITKVLPGGHIDVKRIIVYIESEQF